MSWSSVMPLALREDVISGPQRCIVCEDEIPRACNATFVIDPEQVHIVSGGGFAHKSCARGKWEEGKLVRFTLCSHYSFISWEYEEELKASSQWDEAADRAKPKPLLTGDCWEEVP